MIIQIAKPVLEQKKLYLITKRAFDIVCSFLGLLILAIPMIIIALIITLDSPGPPIFKQERLGLHGKPFMIYKFRSMRLDAEENGPQWADEQDPRCTHFGQILRRTRLDELPQFYNILRGDMSFVGPRPERAYFYGEFEKYIPGFSNRLMVVPGLTGHAQVNTFNFGFAVKSLIIYLWGPWAAYLFGKWFVLSDNSDRSFQEMTNTLTFGFFLHGVLNLLAYLKSDYYAQYAYQRVSVDFWRGDMVSVISTGFMFTFAVALSTSILFSHCGVRKKLIALAVLLMSTFEASFFAYRTMIFIVLILVAFNLLRWLHDSSVRISRKALLIGLAALFFVAIFAIVFLNAFGIQDELLSLKIVRRLLYGDKSSRFKTWTSYLFSGDWLRYPFGGQKSEFAYHGEWVHNLWLDILNKVGLIPFVIAVIFTITSIRSAYGAAVRMKKANHNLLSNQIASLGLGALLICMPEPVVDANPYFFFAILMLLGGIKGVECSFGKEDTAESERGF